MNQRRLVGMSMGARKRAARAHFMRWNYEMSVANRAYVLALFSPWDAAAVEYKRLRGLVRIGQRLRPCPGCPSCTDSSRLQVIGYVRRIGGRVRIDRTLDVSGQSAFYVIIFSWRHEGPMQKLRGFETKQLAWEHLQEYWGYRGHLPRLCDGSGVLPARAKKVRR